MTPATLYREGTDLDALLANLDAEFPGRVQVVEVLHPREGGVLGFFARQRVGVHYRLVEPPEAAPESPVRSATEQDDAGAEFARLLAELAVRTATERRAADQAAVARTAMARPTVTAGPPVTARPPAMARRTVMAEPPGSTFLAATPPRSAEPAVAPTADPVTADPVTADSVTAVQVGSARFTGTGRLALRRELIEIGVPIDLVPTDAPHAYAAVEELVAQLPEAPTPPTGPGRILVVAGPAGRARLATEAIVTGASIDPERVWAYGHSSELVPARRTIGSPRQARSVAEHLRETADGPAVVVVTTDELPAWGAPIVEVIDAIRPDALWAIVDATCKPADTRAFLARLGTPTALVVADAGRTSSPATAWDLGIPIAMLDDRPSSGPAWAVLLLEALARLERTCSGARR